MSVLKVLEEKLFCLAELVKEYKTENAELKNENARLAEEAAQLEAKMVMLQNSLQSDKQEKELTRLVVDDLIKSIDSLIENQS